MTKYLDLVTHTCLYYKGLRRTQSDAITPDDYHLAHVVSKCVSLLIYIFLVKITICFSKQYYFDTKHHLDNIITIYDNNNDDNSNNDNNNNNNNNDNINV